MRYISIIALFLAFMNYCNFGFSDDSKFKIDFQWVRSERDVIREKYERLLGDLPSKKTQEKFISQYKEEKFWKEYDRIRLEIATQRRILAKSYQETQNEKHLKEAEKLFVKGFNTLFIFWEGAGYNLRKGLSMYPQYWKTCCSVFLFYILQDMGARFPENVESKPFQYKAVPVWRSSPEEVLCSYNNVWKNFADWMKKPRDMWADKKIKCFETVKADPSIPNRMNSFMEGESGSKYKFYLGGRWDHVFIVAQDLENGSAMSVFHALGVVEKFSITKQAIVNSGEVIYLLPLTLNFYKQWLGDVPPEKK